MERLYYAIIGDIVASRRVAERGELQKRLKRVLAEINRDFCPVIAADFLITLGDEFQGLLFANQDAHPAVIAERIMSALYPVRVRIAIGLGGISTEIDRYAALGADGSAFHRARSGIERIRTENRGGSALRFVCEPALDTPINSVFGLICALFNRRTAKQNEAAALYLFDRASGRASTQTELALCLGITQGTMSVRLCSANAAEYAAGLYAAETLIKAVLDPPSAATQTGAAL
ncbi:MAG: hypothetical protein IKS90_02820 [Clostridia bacterium]|nr:hypothetical protein [Clostridia bacterium]